LSKGTQITLRIASDRSLAEDWELALLSQGLSPEVSHAPEGFVVSVPEEEARRAEAALSAYEGENPREPRARDEAAEPPDLLTGASVAVILLLFYVFIEIHHPAAPWLEQGSADAGRIARGEIWRAVTALTLHAGLPHVLANAAGTAFFLGALSGLLGPGVASALVLLSGAAGNLANALVRGVDHVSVGASTAVFGAVGALGGIGLVRRGRRNASRRRAWAPVAAALALLAMLGTAGERVDVLAHLFGFLFGGLQGALTAWLAPSRPGPRVQWTCGGVALAALIYCWLLALS
jgi:membrane associated rhomboid family serine protease